MMTALYAVACILIAAGISAVLLFLALYGATAAEETRDTSMDL